MKKYLISIIISFVVSFLIWIISSFLLHHSPQRASSPHKSTESIEQSTPQPMDPSTTSAPSTDYSEKELCRTVNVYDSTGMVFCTGTINARETLLDLEIGGQFDLIRSDDQQYKYMTVEQFRGRGKLYVTKLK